MKNRILRFGIAFTVFSLVTGALAWPSPVFAATYVVNTTDSRWDVGCNPCTADHCSLWEAAVAATVHPGPDRITFDLPGDPPYFIYIGDPEYPGRVYPEINLWDDQTEIDATTQPGWPIYLHGLGESGWGMIVHSNRNTIRGLGFLGFTEAGVEVRGNGNFLDRIVVGEYLGEELIPGPTSNDHGIFIGGENNTIRGATVANNERGILIRAGQNTIQDSHIGSVMRGGTRRGNHRGVVLSSAGWGSTIERNTIVGNDYGMVVLSDENTINGNYFGWDPARSAPIGNGTGILLATLGGGNRIGGTGAYEGNVIVDNEIGIVVAGIGSQILNNRIGVDFRGAAIPNRIGVLVHRDPVYGIVISPEGNLLGGVSGAGNVIAYNTEEGVLVAASSQIVMEQNIIHHNGGHGIGLTMEGSELSEDGMRITIRRNSIYDNGGLGIHIAFPALANDVAAPENLRYGGGTVTGTACPGCIVDIYEAAADPSGSGEGKTFLASTDAAGDGSFSTAVAALPVCSRITATATDALGNTSVFSLNANALLCFRLPPLMAWIIIFGGAGAGAGAAMLITVRRQPLTLRRSPWLILGAALGLGLAVLILLLPFVRVEWPSRSPRSNQSQPAIPTLPLGLLTEDAAPQLSTNNPTVTETATATPTETLPPTTPTVTLLQNANCRRGPGTDYDAVTNLPQGSNAPITGRNQNRTWWQVVVQGTQTQCWLAGENVETSGDLSNVPVVEAEPLGCWVKQPQAPDKCVSPCPQGADPGGACEP